MKGTKFTRKSSRRQKSSTDSCPFLFHQSPVVFVLRVFRVLRGELVSGGACQLPCVPCLPSIRRTSSLQCRASSLPSPSALVSPPESRVVSPEWVGFPEGEESCACIRRMPRARIAGISRSRCRGVMSAGRIVPDVFGSGVGSARTTGPLLFTYWRERRSGTFHRPGNLRRAQCGTRSCPVKWGITELSVDLAAVSD